MRLDRWIALVILGACLAYGYNAWFVLDDSLPPFMRNNPVWPSTFPKILSILASMCCLGVLFDIEKRVTGHTDPSSQPSWSLFDRQNVLTALALIGLMILYILLLRVMGFVSSTTGFLIAGSALLGERRWIRLPLIALLSSLLVWILIQQVLGIYLKPWPSYFDHSP